MINSMQISRLVNKNETKNDMIQMFVLLLINLFLDSEKAT